MAAAGAGAGAGAAGVAAAPSNVSGFTIGADSSGQAAGGDRQRTEREQHRRAQFKSIGTDRGERHVKKFVQIRKQHRREAMMAKRRRAAQAGDAGHGVELRVPDAELASHIANLSVDAKRLASLKVLRRILMVEDPPIQKVLDAGAMAPLVDALMHGRDEVQLEACWCLSNIATGSESQTRLVLRAGPHLIALLRLETPVVAEQAAWALGNVAGDSQEFRDVLLRNGVLVPAVALLSSKDQAVVRTASWLISNLVRGSTPSKPFVDAGVLPPFKKWLQASTPTTDVLVEIAWALSFLSAREIETVQTLATQGFIPLIVRLLDDKSPQLAFPAVRVVGNMCGCGDAFSAAFLACPAFLTSMGSVLMNTTLRAQPKEVMWALSNVAAGPQTHRAAIAAAGFIKPACKVLADSAYDIQAQVVYFLANMSVSSESTDILRAIVAEPNVTVTFIKLLSVHDADVVYHCLGFLERVLEHIDGAVVGFEGAGGLEALDDIRYRSGNAQLSATAGRIADKYFGDDAGLDDDEDLADDAAAGAGDLTFPGVGVSGAGAGAGAGAVAGGTGRGRGHHMSLPAWAPAPAASAGRGMHMAQPAWATPSAAAAPAPASQPSGAAARTTQPTLASFGFVKPRG